MSPSIPTVPLIRALTIATSDSGAGAGIQADLKTFAAHRVYGLSVLSAVSAQNSVAVTGLECLSPSLVLAQLEAIYDDLPPAAVKIGLLGDTANTLAVAAFLAERNNDRPVVLDPVMVSTSGHVFLSPEEVEALKQLMALVTIVTPNIREAEALSGISIKKPQDAVSAAEAIVAFGVRQVLIKGGEGSGPGADDLLFGPHGITWFRGARVDTPNDHGTGCTLSSAICANLATGLELHEAIRLAKEYVTEGLKYSFKPGRGAGPLNHFYQYYNFESRAED